MAENVNKVITAAEGAQMASNFCVSKGDSVRDVARLWDFLVYANQATSTIKSYKVAVVCICVNPPYWPYAKSMIEGAKTYLLPGHKLDFFLWSDMPEDTNYGATVFPIDPIEWPGPTLFRYNLFLQQEEKLREYDYVFYCDVDMKFVDYVGDEILGEGITAALHPMYALRKEYKAPYEPNPESLAYVKRPSYYFAGGFQGGKTDDFIKAMKSMRRGIDDDMVKNYTAIWNDESHWNKYLYENPPSIILSPSYVCPDSLIKEYYEKLWGCSYTPKLITITKPFTTSKDGGEAIKKTLSSL